VLVTLYGGLQLVLSKTIRIGDTLYYHILCSFSVDLQRTGELSEQVERLRVRLIEWVPQILSHYQYEGTVLLVPTITFIECVGPKPDHLQNDLKTTDV
jgi:hypothetical protein